MLNLTILIAGFVLLVGILSFSTHCVKAVQAKKANKAEDERMNHEANRPSGAHSTFDGDLP